MPFFAIANSDFLVILVVIGIFLDLCCLMSSAVKLTVYLGCVFKLLCKIRRCIEA